MQFPNFNSQTLTDIDVAFSRIDLILMDKTDLYQNLTVKKSSFPIVIQIDPP